MIFEESGLVFTFSNAWQARPFDDHRFYRWVSGLGLRGVDFLGIYEGKLILMEVKNYRRREGMPAKDAFQTIGEDPRGLAVKMEEKVSGSIRLIRAVDAYYRRRRWSRWLERLPDRLKRWYPQRHFWQTAAELADDPACCVFVLWLDTDNGISGVEEKLRKALEDDLAEYVEQVVIAGREGHPFGTDLQVSAVWKD